MYPEGSPDDMSVQEMLHWQYLTMVSRLKNQWFGPDSGVPPMPFHLDSIKNCKKFAVMPQDSMYRRIAASIQEFDARCEGDPRKSAHPTDYLSFYCLAKQESPDDQPQSLQEPRPGSEAGT